MPELKKALTTRGLTMIAIGACIGSGIFVTPANSMQTLHHHGFVLLTWFIGGIIAFLGAMTFSELGARYPNEGGVYVYLKKAYGDLAGFLYGWVILLIVNTGALAALGYALADYLRFFIILSDWHKSLIAIYVIWALTIINIFGVNISQSFASIFTGLKLLAMLVIIFTGFWFLPSNNHLITLDLTYDIPNNLIQGILIAFIGVFWSMGGWHHATYMAGETINPSKTVPKAMLIGTLTVTVFYLLIIFSYMILLPSDIMAGSTSVAGDAVAQVLTGGGKLVSIAIAISIFGTIGIYTMTAPRIYYAMARDGIFFSFLADVSTKYKTPYKAMLFQAFWATILIMAWGSFIRIITFVTFMDILFMALATASIFVFRKRDSNFTGFRLKWYPVIPIGYLLITVVFVVNTLAELNLESWAGMAILLAGLPVFSYFKNQRNQKKIQLADNSHSFINK